MSNNRDLTECSIGPALMKSYGLILCGHTLLQELHSTIGAQILPHKPPKFGNFQLTRSQILKFSVHKPLFQRQVSVHKPHTSEIWAAHPYLKKVECPPGNGI